MRRGFLNSKGTRKPEVVGESFKEATQTPAKADLASTVDKTAQAHAAKKPVNHLVAISPRKRIENAFQAKSEERAALRQKYNLEETNPRVSKLSLLPGMGLYLRYGDMEGAGMRVLTLPPLPFEATHYVNDKEATLCLLWPYVKESLMELPGFPMAISSTEVSKSRPYTIRSSTAGGGHGVFAKRSLISGDLIIAERPLLLMPMAMLYDKTDAATHPNIITDNVVNKIMGVNNRAFFYSLHNCKRVSGDMTRIRGIIDTNSLGATEEFPGPHQGIGYSCIARDISRVNHSCSPNASFRFDNASLGCELRALWPIEEGEEITISYGPGSERREERQRLMKAKYNFQCKCAACVLPKNASDKADRERAKLATRYEWKVKQQSVDIELEEVERWAKDLSQPSDVLIKEYLGVVEAMGREQYGQADLFSRCSTLLCATYLALDNLEEAKRWAKKAYRMMVVERGEMGAVEMKSTYDCPEASELLGKFWKMRPSK